MIPDIVLIEIRRHLNTITNMKRTEIIQCCEWEEWLFYFIFTGASLCEL